LPPDSWFFLPWAFLNPGEKESLLEQIRQADLMAEELGETTRFIDGDLFR